MGLVASGRGRSKVTVQTSLDRSNWYDNGYYDTVGAWLIRCPVPGVYFRIGVKQADYSAAVTAYLKR